MGTLEYYIGLLYNNSCYQKNPCVDFLKIPNINPKRLDSQMFSRFTLQRRGADALPHRGLMYFLSSAFKNTMETWQDGSLYR